MKNSTECLPEILRALRGNKTQEDVAKETDITYQTLSNYETGNRVPRLEILAQLAEYYHVSTDYLLGLTKVKNPDPDVRSIAEKTGLSQLSVETIRNYKEDDPDLLIALNFLIEDDNFKEALSRLDDYKYDLMKSRLPLIEYTKAIASGEPPKESLIIGLDQAADRVHASEYYIVQAFQKVIDSWKASKSEEIEELSPEEISDQALDKKIRLG